MSETEFDYLMDAVRSEMEAEMQHDLRSQEMFFAPIPTAANDNDGPWPLMPFPDGWEASC